MEGHKFNSGIFTLGDCTIKDVFAALVDNKPGAEFNIEEEKKKIIGTNKEKGLVMKLKFFAIEDPDDEDNKLLKL